MIIHDVLKPNEQLPSVRLLAKQLTINPNTIQKAYRELEREGYIYSIPGKGSFVANKKEAIYDEKVKQLEESIFKLCQEAFYIGVKKSKFFRLLNAQNVRCEEERNLIQINHVSKRFGELEAIKDVTFSVTKGRSMGYLDQMVLEKQR
ncbi:HTH-type transcriptional repressor YtrA [Anoxybacillus sp. BCO1]|nr:HTH-type transcriptional repressor YtrA [Anoxybacillus sp. BCO1]